MSRVSSNINILELFGAKMDAEFAVYNASRPEIYRMFCETALGLIRKGHKHYSADAILHVIRYKQAVNKEVGELFKINNNYTSRYARKFIKDYPQHAGFFEMRVLKSTD